MFIIAIVGFIVSMLIMLTGFGTYGYNVNSTSSSSDLQIMRAVYMLTIGAIGTIFSVAGIIILS